LARFEFQYLGKRPSEYVVVERGVVGRAGAMRAMAPSLPPHSFEAHAEVLCYRRQRYNDASVVERPPHRYGQQLELVEGISPRRLICHCTDKARYIYSATLHICRVVPLLLRQRRGAGLGELQQARGRSKYFATAPAHAQRTLYGAQSSGGWSGKTT
jgi:hypothetical protein